MISKSRPLGGLLLALSLAACETAPEPVVQAPEPVLQDVVVEVYAPEPVIVEKAVPSIDIEEYERQRAANEAARIAYESAAAPTPVITAEPDVEQTLEQRLAAASTPDRKIAILRKEPTSNNVNNMIRTAYESKLSSDRASGNNAGAAEALVFLGQLEAKGGARANNMAALGKYAEALQLDPENSQAPRLVSQARGQLQGYSDTLHKEAVSYFVKQDFAPAVSRWEKVLLIDPGNSAARNWYNQAKEAMDR